MDIDVAVLGCGWAGILVSEALARRGHSVICLEKESEPGGLLRSEHYSKFVIDVGGSHVIFSRNESILNKMLSLLGDNVHSHTRLSYIRLMKMLIPYPLENSLHVIPVEERYEALVSFIEALLSLRNGWNPGNFEEWIYGFFGKWIADKYLVPYNKKIWKRPLNEIDIDWIHVPGRLPIPNWRDVVKSALGIRTIGYSEQATFYYPIKGGIYALFESVYRKARNHYAHIITNYFIKSIKKKDNYFIINDQIKSRRIYSTIPIPDLIKALGEELYIERKQLDLFDYNKVIVVAVAVNKPAPNQHWVYVPDENIVFHRYAWLSNYSPYNSPPGKSLVLAEITIPKGADAPRDIIGDTISDFEKLDLFRSDEVIFAKQYIHEYGYPIHKVSISSKRAEVLEEVEKHGIVSLGRWGSWRYLNMDMVLMDVLTKLDTLH